jgi:membrane fusion protein, multidrug efflux system
MKGWMNKHRRQLLIGVPVIFFLLAFIIYIFSGRYVSSDDSYVQAAKASINSYVPGHVLKIYVHDNQEVKKNAPLFSLDDRYYKIAVANAKAQLINARLQILALKATYQQHLANVQQAQETLDYQKEEYDRQKKLAANGISSQIQLEKTTNAYQNANQQFLASQHQLANVLASLNNNADLPVDAHPTVLEAQAQLDQANLNLSYTVITAPIDGIVTKVEQLQPGDYIKAGDPVFALISNKDIWVEANFKETDMTYMRPGQQAEITIDAYPDKTFKGVVASASPGTGSAFSLLPPENATGNWVKIVQRLPVRITIQNPDPALALSSGLSANVTVDTKHSRIFSSDEK